MSHNVVAGLLANLRLSLDRILTEPSVKSILLEVNHLPLRLVMGNLLCRSQLVEIALRQVKVLAGFIEAQHILGCIDEGFQVLDTLFNPFVFTLILFHILNLTIGVCTLRNFDIGGKSTKEK